MAALSRSELPLALAAWRKLCVSAEYDGSLVTGLSWLQASWNAGNTHLPLYVLHDLGHLLLQGRDFRFSPIPDGASETLRNYERCVARFWATDPSILEAHILLAGLPLPVRQIAIPHALDLALAKPLLALEGLAHGNPANLRPFSEGKVPLPEGEDEGWDAWAIEELEAVLEVLPKRDLLRPEDLWELVHLRELPSESTRFALREVNGLAGRIGPAGASTRANVHHAIREAPVEAVEPEDYPIGGFEGVSTKGSLENLVRSEVAYVGEGVEESGGVDLFDIRFIEGDLLYYTRDEAPKLARKHRIAIVLDGPLSLRSKHPAMPSQAGVICQALALVVLSDAVKLFGDDGVFVSLSWRCGSKEDREVAEEEMDLLKLPLASEMAHRRVAVGAIKDWSEVEEKLVVVFSLAERDPEVPCTVWVTVAGEDWTALGAVWKMSEGARLIRALVDALLIAIAGRKKS